MRIIADIKRYRAGPSGKIKRLFRIHRQHCHPATLKPTGRIVIGRFTKLAVANNYIVGRCNSGRPIASLKLGRRPSIVHALTKINIVGSTRYSPDIGIKIAGAARDARVLGVERLTEGNFAAQLQAAVVRIPGKATTLSGAWRPRDPVDDDRGGARA